MAETAQLIPWQFKPGQSGNPGGRPKGSRHAIEEAFLKDLLADWRQYGIQAIEQGRLKDPMGYVKTVASLMPTKIDPEDGLDGISRDELRTSIDALQRWIASGAAPAVGSEAGEPRQAIGLPALPETDGVS